MCNTGTRESEPWAGCRIFAGYPKCLALTWSSLFKGHWLKEVSHHSLPAMLCREELFALPVPCGEFSLLFNLTLLFWQHSLTANASHQVPCSDLIFDMPFELLPSSLPPSHTCLLCGCNSSDPTSNFSTLLQNQQQIGNFRPLNGPHPVLSVRFSVHSTSGNHNAIMELT